MLAGTLARPLETEVALAELVIGVDLGGTKIRAGLVGRDGTIDRHRERATPTSSQDDLLTALDAAVEELIDDRVVAIGFAIPSTIDQAAGRAVFSTNIPLANLDFRDRMHDRWQLPVAIEN